jgi:hypothetical protein
VRDNFKDSKEFLATLSQTNSNPFFRRCVKPRVISTNFVTGVKKKEEGD